MPQPFIKFYFADWEGDAQLMGCSLAAQGLWLRMMRVMHEAEPYGFFVGRAGEPVDVVAFSKRVGVAPRQVRTLIAELENAHVCSRDSQDRIYSRRLVRDFARSLQAIDFGRRGGNPNLISSDITPGVNPTDKLSRARALDHNPEAQILDNSDSLRSSALERGTWPDSIEALRSLALLFVAEFANCRDANKAEKHIGPYTGVLASMRSRGVTIADAWDACIDAREACGGKPLWGASVKSAMSFLRPRGAAPKAGRTYDRGEEMDRAVAAQQERKRKAAGL